MRRRRVTPHQHSKRRRQCMFDGACSLTYDERFHAFLAGRMRIAYLECFSGISGDMFLGALLDAGVPLELFQETVTALNVEAALEVSRVDRGGLSATKVDVVISGHADMPREEFWEQRRTKREQLEEVPATAPVHSHHAEG